MLSLFNAPPVEPGLFDRFKTAVSKTRTALTEQIENIFEGQKQIDAELLEDLEMSLIGADLGVRTTSEILENVRKGLAHNQTGDAQAVQGLIAEHMLEILKQPEAENTVAVPSGSLEVILVVGVNGVGKTTTIGKLANRLKGDGRSVLLCASDTFRAAATEQLVIWGERTDCPVIRQKLGADPSAVLYDGIKAAKARGLDTVIVDTAGRLHNKTGLMAELEKICRTAERLVPGAPQQVLLVIDAVTGQNGLEQAKQFTAVAGVTGLVLTKLDGTAKGGIVVAIAREMGTPIRWVGIGEQIEDLVAFESTAFVRALFQN